jgi:hypothetical protein
MKDYQQAIEQLKQLDLSKNPRQEILALLNQFGKFGLVQKMFHKGKTMIRARPNQPGERFTTRKELSYKPVAFNNTYQRASTPDQTMFYAGVIHEDLEINDLDNARVIATLEASQLLREHGQEGEQLITFSKWEVTQDIPMVAICYHKDFTEKNSHTKELYEAFHQWIAGLDEDLQERSIGITEFLAGEYAKKEIHSQFDYMISALFSEKTIQRGGSGIFYPSVKTDAMGFNVALSPACVDSSLKLVAAGECTIYKKGDKTIVDNETVCVIEDDTVPFELKPVAAEHHRGRESVMSELEAV